MTSPAETGMSSAQSAKFGELKLKVGLMAAWQTAKSSGARRHIGQRPFHAGQAACDASPVNVVPTGPFPRADRPGMQRHPFTGQLDQGVGAVDTQAVVDELAQVGKNGLVIHEGCEVLVEAEQPAHRLVPLLSVADEFRLQPVKVGVELSDLGC